MWKNKVKKKNGGNWERKECNCLLKNPQDVINPHVCLISHNIWQISIFKCSSMYNVEMTMTILIVFKLHIKKKNKTKKPPTNKPHKNLLFYHFLLHNKLKNFLSISLAVAHIPHLPQFVEWCHCVLRDTQSWKYLWTWWIKLSLNTVIKDLPFTLGKRSCMDKVTLFQNDNWKHLKLSSSSRRNKAQKSAAIPVLRKIAEHKGLPQICHKTSSELQPLFGIFLSHWSSVATTR